MVPDHIGADDLVSFFIDQDLGPGDGLGMALVGEPIARVGGLYLNVQAGFRRFFFRKPYRAERRHRVDATGNDGIVRVDTRPVNNVPADDPPPVSRPRRSWDPV